MPPGIEAKPECEVRVGNFLISRANTEDLVARSVIVKESPIRLMMSDKIVRFSLSQKIEKDFIILLIYPNLLVNIMLEMPLERVAQ